MATKKNPRIPPHSNEAEESVLGSILIDKDAVSVVAPLLKPNYFYNENNGQIYETALMLYENRRPIDLVTLTSELKKTKNFSRIGGASYLAELTNRVATAVNVEEYAQIIKRNWIKRQLISSSGRISSLAFDETKEAREVLEEAEKEIFSLSQSGITRSFIPVKDALIESFDRLDELHKKSSGLRGLPSGFSQLDNLLAGMQNSNLLILAARPGIGKTALSLNVARHVAVEEKIPVGIFSLEMSQEELVDRLLVRQAQIDSWKLKTGRLDEDDFSRLSDAMGTLAEAPLYIDDTPGISILEMRTKARKLQMEKGLKLLIVDYLQLIHGRSIDNRVQEVSEISQGLKNLARELKIPILSLSQLSRAVEVRGGQRPRLADLRESGSIEQDSDVVMFLYREDDDDRENVVLEIAKHRNGPIGSINLSFVQKQISFYPLEKQT
ncbi:MAG: replicative DNA helicase [Candidatus Shapirobacteria bacterium]|nr:replicative DNA helicase [Candidatus Shapirobacteria bacterium]